MLRYEHSQGQAQARRLEAYFCRWSGDVQTSGLEYDIQISADIVQISSMGFHFVLLAGFWTGFSASTCIVLYCCSACLQWTAKEELLLGWTVELISDAQSIV